MSYLVSFMLFPAVLGCVEVRCIGLTLKLMVMVVVVVVVNMSHLVMVVVRT
jgi:hypothetical protein